MLMVIMGSHLTMESTLITLEKINHWNKNIITNICRIQAYHLIMCGYFFIGFTDFVLKDKSFLDYENLLSSNEYEKNDRKVLKYFQ